ncbi:NTP transferase domain-containing protein [Nesterenkonia sp. HG001]|uniref:NTP transferase domain-containing protein n=1 Tax=Nesterenkonia sp. HG001 TaxID=2983207 RepID=UPI002AC5D4AB|nr:NTP transferase domain-containing protein [Nesterenkonia sp. HG001]MDZ5078912.1 NTP transferase domain-containing protein [Nesterenkonia sp. HG001]
MPPEDAATTTAAVLLAGGRGSRLGGVQKGLLTHLGIPLITAWADALELRGVETVVVGPDRLRPSLPEGVDLVREDPPYSGPAAALCAGVRALEARASAPDAHRPQHVLLLSVDTLDPGPVLDWLLDHLPADGTLIPQDKEGRQQMLTAAVEAEPLRRRVLSLVPGEEVGRPVRWLLEGMEGPGAGTVVRPLLPEGLGVDVDTAADARRHGVSLPPAGTDPELRL